MGLVHTIRSAKNSSSASRLRSGIFFEEVSKGSSDPAQIGAPTLHRLSIQAFEPALIEGDRDLDSSPGLYRLQRGLDADQMAVHVPLSVEAQMESGLLMLARIISSRLRRQAITTPTQDIALGGTISRMAAKKDRGGDTQAFEVVLRQFRKCSSATDERDVKTHERIRLKNPDYGRQTVLR